MITRYIFAVNKEITNSKVFMSSREDFFAQNVSKKQKSVLYGQTRQLQRIAI